MLFGRSGCKRRVWINRGVTVTKTLILALMVALVSVSPAGYGQVAGYQTPLDVPTDPRGVGMGESLVALRANTSAIMYNPAGLAGLKGTSVAYTERKMNWFSPLEEFKYYGVNASVETPIGVFGARYDRFSMGVGSVQTNTPQGYTDVTTYQHDVILGFGTGIAGGLEVGAAAKYYDYVFAGSGGTESEISAQLVSTTPAWLFDGGVLYTVPGLSAAGALVDELTFGVSLQNVGTKIKYRWEGVSQSSDQPLPGYFHAGCALKVGFPPAETAGPSLLTTTFTLEYTNLLNYTSDRVGGSASWGAGLELVLGEIVSLRGGFVVRPVTSIYGEGGSVAYRYGTGVDLPLERLGIRIPLILSAEYSAIPLHDVGIGFLGPQRHTLDAFSFEVRMK